MAYKCMMMMIIVLGVSLMKKIQCFSATNIEYLKLPDGVVGPETLVFDCEGKGPYAGVSDGRILKWESSMNAWTNFATIVAESSSCNGPTLDIKNEELCGRPLGLKFNPKTCELYIADSYYGLMKVGPSGGIATQLVSSANGVRIGFTNNLDIDPTNGVVYFTDTSTIFPRWEWPLVVATMDRTGRLIRYDPNDGSVSTLLAGLAFPNGVALSEDTSFLLWTETTTKNVNKYWLKGPKSNTNEFLLHLVDIPDNINRNSKGEFWVAQGPAFPVKIDSSGNILDTLYHADLISDVNEFNGRIWLGSVTKPFVEVRS